MSEGGSGAVGGKDFKVRNRHRPVRNPHIKKFIQYRAEGLNEYDALEKAGLPRRKGLAEGLARNHTVSTAIINKARQGVNLVKTVEDSFGRLDRFINDEEADPMVVLKAIDTLFRAMSRQDILSLRERAAMEQNPATRVELARQVLAQLKEATIPRLELIPEPVIEYAEPQRD